MAKPSTSSIKIIYLLLFLFVLAAISIRGQSPQMVECENGFTLNKISKNWMDGRVRWIATTFEKAAFKKLDNDDERRKFVDNFWLRRDPDSETDENEFLTIYCERIAETEKFASGIPGWKTDRGRIYIIWGPPDRVESGRSSFDNIDNVPFERWHYFHVENIGKISIVFVGPTETDEYRLSTSDKEKLEPIFECLSNGLVTTISPGKNNGCANSQN